MTIKFLIIFFIILSIKTNFPNNICHCSIVEMTKTRGGVFAIGDRMITQNEPYLEDILNNALNDAYEIRPYSRKHMAEMNSAFVQNLVMTSADIPFHREKVQLVRGGNNKQFAVGLVGFSNTIENFVAADKSNVKSIKSLAKLMDKVHRDSEDERANILGEQNIQREETEYLATDGKEIYGIKAGRSWGPRQKGIRGALKNWWQGRGNAVEGDAKKPKIRKLRGNVHAIGYFPEKIEADLGGKNGPFRGRKRFFGKFGRRMPVNMPMDEAYKIQNEAFAAQSKYLVSPNAVSESNQGYFISAAKNAKTQQIHRLWHTNPTEVKKIMGTPARDGQQIVTDLMKNGLWQDKWMENNGNREVNKWVKNGKKQLKNEKMRLRDPLQRFNTLQLKNGRGGPANSIPPTPTKLNPKKYRGKRMKG